MRLKSVILLVLCVQSFVRLDAQEYRTPSSSFVTPPDSARPRVYWWWLYNRVDKEGITRDLEEFRAKGISGVNLICTGGYAGQGAILGVEFLGDQWRDLFRHALREAKRLNIEIGFNLAGGWTMMGPWVTRDNAMKKLVFSELRVTGPSVFNAVLPKPEVTDSFYHDIRVQAFRLKDKGKTIDPRTLTNLTANLGPDGQLRWKVPAGEWIILRSGYTLTGHPWSRWYTYPKGDTFEGGEGYEIDYLNSSSLDDHFDHLGKLVIEENRKAGGKLAYLWSDSWECGKLTWTQDFFNQFKRFRGYELEPWLPAMAGYTVQDSLVTSRLREDFDRTIQDCIAENFYGHFKELCRENGLRVGNEAGGPNDIPPQDALKNLGRCDIPSGEFWVNYTKPGEYNSDPGLRLNLKQTATAAHIYGIPQVQAEAFTQMQADRTHWSHGPSDLKPYANDAFCEGINRFMLHQATCQPPSDGKPGYEFCAGQHFTPNITWWEQTPAFFDYLSRCQYLLQQGKFAADVCFYLGERPPTLAPPDYIVPSLGPGYDCDYANAEVLLTRMSVRDGKIVLPDGMNYRLLVLQNCVSPVPEICKRVSSYQQLNVSSEPSVSMSPEMLRKIRELILAGATVIGAPPQYAAGLRNWPACDEEVRTLATEIWGDLDGKIKTERSFGKGRVIWGKTAREVLLADGIGPDVTFPGQENRSEDFDYIHRTTGSSEIYFVINRTNRIQQNTFTFRVSGKQPEIWNPVTGDMRSAEAFRQQDGCTSIPLELDAFGSCFIVFNKSVNPSLSGKAARNFPEMEELVKITGNWQVSFDPQWGGPARADFPELVSWTMRPESGIKYYSGKGTYRIAFDLAQNQDNITVSKKPDGRLWLDLGDVRQVAEVRLNGKNLGILWCAPWRVDITDAILQAGNILEIDVINLWANRVIGDLSLPKEQRFTKTHDVFRFDMLRGSTPLLESGLLGPVRVLAESKADPASLADPLTGTSNSRWMLGPYACVPFGMVQLGPDNQSEGWMSGYEYSISNVTGFSHLHAWTMGGLMIMPSAQDLTTRDGAADKPYRGAGAGYHSRIIKESEQASPGYYSVDLYDACMKAEMTATTRCGFFRFTAEKDFNYKILIDLAFPSEYNFKLDSAVILRKGDSGLEGFAKCHVGSWNQYTLWFVIRFNRALNSFGGWNGEGMVTDPGLVAGSGDAGAIVTWKGRKGEVLMVQTGLSLVDMDGARRNLQTEMDPFRWDFDAAALAARSRWNELFSAISVEGGSEENQRKFYTNFYRSYCAKQTWSDVDGRYRDPKEEIRQMPAGTSIYGGDAFWNSFWNLNGLLALASPDILNNWVVTQLELFKSTGWTSDGPTGIEMSGIMEVSHEIALMVGAYQKGIRNYDPELLYQAIKHTVDEQGRRLAPWSGPAGNIFQDVYKRLGYVPYEIGPACQTLDYAFNDFCVAMMAQALGKTDDYRFYLKRSENWRNLFHPELKWSVPRDSLGNWLPGYSPFSAKHWIEGNGWEYSFYVPHNIPGLIKTMGTDLFNSRLDEGFEKSRPYSFAAHALDRTEGQTAEFYVNHGNEVNMQAAWLFNYSGKPWLTQKYVREILGSFYGSDPYHGWEGDEDEGQMGAWYVMSAIGLFSMDGGTSPDPVFDLSTPLFDRITLRLDKTYYGGKTFTIETKNLSDTSIYIKSATLNGKRLDRLQLRFSDIVRGGTLVIETTDEHPE